MWICINASREQFGQEVIEERDDEVNLSLDSEINFWLDEQSVATENKSSHEQRQVFRATGFCQ